MSKHTSPWTPSAEKLRLLLDPRDNPADETMVTWLAIVAAQAGHLDRLADLIHRTFTNAMKDAGATAREECLLAIQSIIEEVDGKRSRESASEDAFTTGFRAGLAHARAEHETSQDPAIRAAIDQLEADQAEGDRRREQP
jgi:hypothetical protein